MIPGVEYMTLAYASGKPCQPDTAGAVSVHWPLLRPPRWEMLLAMLRENRERAPTGEEFWRRLRSALQVVARRFADQQDGLRRLALGSLPSYTGFSEAMIAATLGALDWFALEELPAAFRLAPTLKCVRSWQPMPGLPGQMRFYPSSPWLGALPVLPNWPIFGDLQAPSLVLGYAAGNVPGSALMMAFLAQAVTTLGGTLPVVVVKNSRSEPIFSPLVLQALEEADPDLVCTTAVLVWDYEDNRLQKLLLGQAGLVLAAASDETIAQIQAQAAELKPPVRFHGHGHKVSFSVVGKETLQHGLVEPVSGTPLLDVVSLLAGLDSAFWDQHGCLSARLHFVEEGGQGYHTAAEYAAALQVKMQALAEFLPRGAWPRSQVLDRFDRYKQMESTGQVEVLSHYGDDFLVALDRRPMNVLSFRSLVNDCQGRVIIVRPVADLMEVPQRFLSLLPPANLQSLSVAVGQPGTALDERFLHFAEACGRRGVTAIRTVGRGAFPQLSHSWDGFIPLDLVRRRPAGRFTTIEFDAPYEQMLATFRLMQVRQ